MNIVLHHISTKSTDDAFQLNILVFNFGQFSTESYIHKTHIDCCVGLFIRFAARCVSGGLSSSMSGSVLFIAVRTIGTFGRHQL
jgi:hypothetical protein